MPSARSRTNSRNCVPRGFGRLLVERRVELDPRAAQGMGQQHFGIQPRAFGAVLLKIVGRPRQQPADGPNFVRSADMGASPSARTAVESSLHQLCPSAHALLLAVVFDQGVDHRSEVAGQDIVELVERQVDAVIGEAVLGKVVGADPLAAVARADLRLAFAGPLGVLSACASARRAGS